MLALLIATAVSSAVVAICRMVFRLYALRGVPPSRRAEIIRALRS